MPYTQRVQTIPTTAPSQPHLITLGSEEGPQGGRSGTAWVKETFAPLKELESCFERNRSSATLRSGAASNWTKAGPGWKQSMNLKLAYHV